MPPKKTGFAGLMAKKPNPLFAAPKYAAAAAAYASAKARPLAVAAYGKAAACHASPDVAAHHTAAAELEKASKLATTPQRADFGGRAAAAWADAGEALRAAETALRCGTETLDQRAAPTRAMDLVAAALDYADAASGHACQPDVARKALGWYARRGLLDDAISTVSKHVKALADANLDPGPALYRTLGASVALHLANRADVDAADGAFMTALGHGLRVLAHDDGTFDVAYDDGDRESGVVKEFVRPAGGSPRRSPRKGKHAAGARVEARYRGKSKFYPGKIAKANDDGSYDIAYDDGESEANVIEALIRPLGGAGAGGAFAVGAAVQARYRGKSKLYPGKVAKDNGDGTYDIDYDDGEKESNVAEALIKASAAAPAATGTGGAFAVGAKVEARYRGKSKYYAGVIAKDNGDGTYDIDYDDGEKESKVAEALIKASAAAAAAAPAAGKGGAFAVGAKVEARYRGKSKYYAGVIAKDNGDGTYDIDYDDGEKESKVAEALIKASAPAPAATGTGGALRWARRSRRYRGKSKYYAGVIAKDNGDGTYDIDYDDGEKETKVAEALIKASAAAPAPAAGKGGAFAVGAKVEAKYRGKSKYYAGVIATDNGDGTYNIDYDDGEKETKVAEALIKASAAAPAPAAPGTGGAFAVGAEVEARYRGKSKYYAGVIAVDNGDGTYNIDYDDGEKETKVAEALIKASAAAPAPAAGKGGAFPVGAKVEAKYRGKSKYYAGVIAADNGDGTYNIDYDDGEKETKVAEALIKASAAAPAPAATGTGGAFAVEARYRGKSKFYAGVIAVDNGDGTYNIDYDDGEKETKVAEALIKASAAAPAATGTGGAFAVGAKVEARYRGKSKYYAGVIAVDNGDGTYNIDYDDGEKESKVAEALIKASAAAVPAAGKGGAFAAGDQLTSLEESQRSTNKLFAAAAALKKTESMASVNAAENLAAAARDLESSTDALAAAGLRPPRRT
ncbi:tudor domain-containing protein [Aureococcus anophagefferens]|nr:tudor domain-containing protein [Aureococcus anophagefferens]